MAKVYSELCSADPEESSECEAPAKEAAARLNHQTGSAGAVSLSDLLTWTDQVTVTTTLQPRQVVDRVGTIWPGEVTTDAGDLSFRGEYVTRGKAMVRVSLEGGIQTVRDGSEVRITLRASPDQAGCIAFPIAAALLPVLALLVDALEPHQVLIWWAAGVGLFAGAQWVAGGLVLSRLARKILGVLDVG